MTVTPEDLTRLKSAAEAARAHAYAPYSHFRVGAALLGRSGRIYTGCNVENASFGATLCAERGAVSAAVVAGEREFAAIAITAGGVPVVPCGICRQVLAEFSPDGSLPVVCIEKAGDRVRPLCALLPDSFTDFESETPAR